MQHFVAVTDDGAPIAERDGDTIVPWWSFTKTIIAAASLVLVRERRLALDAPLVGRAYTLRQLLQHRAGLTGYDIADYHAAVANAEQPWPVAELLARTQAERLRFPPDQVFAYSNIGYLFVRQLIEETSGEPLGTALSRIVLRPLGIASARLAEQPADLRGVAMGPSSYHPGWVYHGLVVGSLLDAAHLLQRLMTGGLLAPELVAQMGDAVPIGHPSIPGRPWNAPAYGLGLMCGRTTDGRRVVGHTGGGPGSVIAVYHQPEASPSITSAAFAFGDDQGRVEEAAFNGGRDHRSR